MRKFTYNLFVWESYDSGLREMKIDKETYHD